MPTLAVLSNKNTLPLRWTVRNTLYAAEGSQQELELACIPSPEVYVRLRIQIWLF